MRQSLVYLLIDTGTILVPFIFSFHPKLNFHRKFRFFFPANLITLFIFCLWDMFFTASGVWGFNQKYVTGLHIYNLPIEEILFFICIPYACVFTYHCFKEHVTIAWTEKTTDIVTALSSAVFLLTGIYFLGRAYTSAVFISLGVLMLVFRFRFKARWIGNLISVYLVLLIPFFVVNGLLTGTGLDEPVVWYNNLEIAGLRILTIPVEDIFYGFELILLNVFFFELFEKKYPAKNQPTVLYKRPY